MPTLLVFSNKKDLVPNTLVLTHVECFDEGEFDSNTDIPLSFEEYVMKEAAPDGINQGAFMYDQEEIDDHMSHCNLVVNEDCFDRLDHDEMIGTYQHPNGNVVTFFGVLI